LSTNPIIATGLDEKYRFEEYFDVDGVKRRRYFTHAAWSKRQARQLMKKKTTPHERKYVYRLGYNHCIGQYQPTDEYPNMSGSSINRTLRQKKKTGARLFLQEPDKIPYQEPHKFSKRSRGKVKDKATAFFRSVPNNRVFVTLTFIDRVTDKQGVKILNKFLTVLRREKPDLQYLWVAEHQENGNIHFHIIMNKRLPIGRYNALWTMQQYNDGLVGRNKHGEIIDRKTIEDAYWEDVRTGYRKKNIQSLLNPFHIDAAKSIDGLSYYLTKYITKQQADDEFGCLNWHCSRKVSKLFTREVVSPSTFSYMCSFANTKVDYRTGEILSEPKPFTKQWFTMVYINNKGAPLSRLRQMEQVNRWIMENFTVDQLTILDDHLYKKIIVNAREPDTTVTSRRRLPAVDAGSAAERLHPLPAVQKNAAKEKGCRKMGDQVGDGDLFRSRSDQPDR
jgi:hypothetical protein